MVAIQFCLNALKMLSSVSDHHYLPCGTQLCSIDADRFSVKGGSMQSAGANVCCSGTSMLGTPAMCFEFMHKCITPPSLAFCRRWLPLCKSVGGKLGLMQYLTSDCISWEA